MRKSAYNTLCSACRIKSYLDTFIKYNWDNKYIHKGVGLQAIVFENEPIYYQGAGLPGGEWTRLPKEETAAAPAQTTPQTVAPAPAASAAPQSAPADPWATQAAPAAAPSNDGFAPAADNPWN